MKSLRRFPGNYRKGLFIILLAYTAVQLLFYHPVFSAPVVVSSYRQLLRWLTITVVYVTGALVLRKTGEDWLKFVWHFVHLLLIAYLLLIGFVEYFIRPVSYGLRASVAPVIEFLISPLLYLGSGIVYLSVHHDGIENR